MLAGLSYLSADAKATLVVSLMVALSTLLRFVHTGWGTGSRWEEARLWQAEAWKQAIDNLKNFLESSEKILGGLSMN